MKRLRARLTYANVMASIAVFIALGGASYAAVRPGKKSVGTPQLKNGAVTTAKIKSGAVTTAKIKNGAVTGAKINLSTLGTVPSATTADSAGTAGTAETAKRADTATSAAHATSADHAATADSATSAGHADSATSAGHADSADHAATADTATTASHADSAADAAALGGAPPQSFMSADRFAFGTADTEPTTPETVLTLGGVEVTTNRPETTPEQFAVRIVNHNSDQWEFTTTGEPGIITVNEGQHGVLGPITTAGSMVIDGRDRVEPEKAIVIECGSDIAPDLLECFAQLSPGA